MSHISHMCYSAPVVGNKVALTSSDNGSADGYMVPLNSRSISCLFERPTSILEYATGLLTELEHIKHNRYITCEKVHEPAEAQLS